MYKNIVKKFSIIELITACAVIVILMTIGVGAYRLIIEKIHETRTVALIKKIEMAMRSYKNETGYFFQYNTKGFEGNLNSYKPLSISDTDTEFIHLIDYSGMVGRKEIDITDNNRVKDAWGNYIFYYTGDDKINSTLFDLGSPGKSSGWGPTNSINDIGQFGTYDDVTNANM